MNANKSLTSTEYEQRWKECDAVLDGCTSKTGGSAALNRVLLETTDLVTLNIYLALMVDFSIPVTDPPLQNTLRGLVASPHQSVFLGALYCLLRCGGLTTQEARDLKELVVPDHRSLFEACWRRFVGEGVIKE